MAHPQHNFTSNFNGSEGHNAELTLNINGTEHKYTPAGNDKEFTVTGAVRINVNLDGSELVERIATVLSGNSLPLLVQQNLDGTEDSYTYVGLQDNEWLFGRVTTTHIDSVGINTTDGSVRHETLPLASDVAIVSNTDPAVYTKLRTAVALGHLPVLDYQGTYATYVTIDNNILKFATEAADPNVESYVYTVASDNTVTATPRNAGVVRADSVDTEPGTLIDKLEVVDNVLDPEDPTDPPILSLEVTVDGQGNRKVAINEDNLRTFVGAVENTFSGLDFGSVPHGSFGSSLNQSPGDGTTTSIQVSIFRPLETTVGNDIEWTKTTEIGGEDFGTVTLEPGTYIVCSDITCQWVGVPAGTYLAQVGNVLGEPFDFSQQQELHRRMTNVVTVSTATQFKMKINFDATTPVMGFWINSAQIVKIAGGMSQTNVTHDSTLTGQGSVADPLGVNTQNLFAGNLASAFVPNSTNAIAGTPYVYGGKLYIAKENYSGAWNASKFYLTSIDELLVKSSNFNGSSDSFSAISGEAVEFGVSTSLSQNDKVYVLVTGDSGVVSLNRFNVKFYLGGVSVDVVSSPVRQLDEWFEITVTADADRITVQRDSAAASGNLTAFFVPERALLKYVKSLIADSYQSLSNDIGTANGRIDTLASKVDSLDVDVNGRTTYQDYDISGAQTGYYYNTSGTAVSNGESSYCTITFDGTDVGKQIVIRVNESTGSSDARCYVLCDENDVVKQYIRNQDIIAAGGTWKFNTSVGASGWYLKCSWKTATGNPSIGYVSEVIQSLQEKVEGYVKYVSTTGNDTNDGSSSSPLKTISKAVELGAETVIVASGVYYDNNINLSKSKHDKITIKGEISERVIFKKANSKLVDSGAETLVTGYSKVYSVTCSDPGYTGTNQWLFFDGLTDLSQPITKQEAHPLERGLFYRNDCTKIVHTTADTLADALDEIEACGANVYKWFYDSGALYFNRSAATSTYPIYRSNGSYLTTRNNQSVELSNLEFRYGSVNLAKINVAKLYNVACKYVYGDGCFTFIDCLSVLFDHCEASSCFRNVNGDGFNGWSNVPADYSARRETTVLRNCWSHDNLDDGYSDHRYSEMTVEGGLFEYNGKGGITPSYGAHCTISNAIARRNQQNGFYYTGTANDNGNGGQMICFCCLSDGNNTSNGASAAGYRCDGNGNRAILVGCKAINELKAFRCDIDAYLDLIDCGTANISGNVTSGAGTITKVPTTVVS